ncbi:TetR family transcriptional regulator [Rodentibacter caecimuris]|uniref:TetR family transcriptional regulator n=1 Tax=Rodentibacter caecimuris TaxID=1796644 RepID=A0A1V3KHQ3_9PAST|nr:MULTISPECIES: TetR/AcrR family transcriptional regulator [Pasteurellaceae]AOF53462.1 Transcriptional regulator, TetR family [Pasteurellaceae bacterium NI1060]MCQ9124141.1 TetR/AcrR family transcriptional regulator [Rodentibacter heylii]MCR1838009.1 TetR/AcrR family transcriptional regulator [Pasteurella caecimuris]MCU0107678.1 TetR/AcrR family transcriptional regulator [Pasteurella caecimuris]MCX2962361.1 TetR/AcrR family transcriptional regulator [Rodentibacter heylii]
MRHAKTNLVEQIFMATDRLMAKEGLNQLSMHKLAKEANVATGTIYLYFKNKDELLIQFARRVFAMFIAALEKDFDESESFFQQYRRMWWNMWQFLQDNPTILSNLNQYQSLPEFTKICREIDNSRWDHFCFQARTANELADLPDDVLFQLSLKTAMTMASDIKFLSVELTREILESVVERSWRAIQK